MKLGRVSWNDWLPAPGTVFTSIKPFSLERRGDTASDARRDLTTGVRVTSRMVHCTKSRGDHPSISAMILAGESQYCVFLAVVPSQGKRKSLADARVLRSMYHQQALLGILIGCASGRFPIRLQCARHDKKTFPTLVVAIWVCGERS